MRAGGGNPGVGPQHLLSCRTDLGVECSHTEMLSAPVENPHSLSFSVAKTKPVFFLFCIMLLSIYFGNLSATGFDTHTFHGSDLCLK